MKSLLVFVVAALVLSAIELVQRRMRRNAAGQRGGSPHARRWWVAPWVQRLWPYLIPGGLLLFGVSWWVGIPATGISIYTFALVITGIGIRGAIYERRNRNR
jgi:hypothetical protein